MTRPRILLATTTSWLSFSRLPRLFAMAGCEVDVMSPPHALVAERKFVSRRLPVAGGSEALCAALIRQVQAEPERYAWVVIGDDELFSCVAACGGAVVDRFFPVKRDAASLAFFASKLTFMERCAANGFSIAPYELCRTIGQAEAAAARLGYPVIVKTPASIGGSGVTRINDRAALAGHVAALTGEFAVQQFAAGRQIIAEILFDQGRPRCWMTSELLNRWPRALGPCSVRRLIDVPAMAEILERIGRLTGFHGFASVDAILPDDGGPPMLSEMNCRPTTGYHFNGRVREEFKNAIRAVLADEPFSAYSPLRATAGTAALFPEALYYLAADPREPQRWGHAIESLRRMPVDDPRYTYRLFGDYARHVRHQIRLALNNRKRSRLPVYTSAETVRE